MLSFGNEEKMEKFSIDTIKNFWCDVVIDMINLSISCPQKEEIKEIKVQGSRFFVYIFFLVFNCLC